ncbi:MAG TPA: radical SAM protein [Pyrinomonadaceae bacterium]|nr:radical SAM protein [Pyrinomonadaceae bacterium]
MSFTAYLQIPEIEARYRKVKKFFYLRESAYDLTSACQLRCDGCYYFEGDKYKVKDNKDHQQWKDFMELEKERGINYVNLAGAEPALVPDILSACFQTIPLGTVFTNGLRKIDPAVGYRIHISVWGDAKGDPKYRRYASGRPGPNCLPIQLENYRNDKRVIFVYTFNNGNIDQVDQVIRQVKDEGHKITFNMFSAPVGNNSPLKLKDMLNRTREKMIQVLGEYGETVVYSYYNAKVHTDESSLRGQFGCPFPRATKQIKPIGIGRTFRSYRADFSHAEADCCVPDTDCNDCRHYAAGSAIITSSLDSHVGSEAQFRGWLDYVDTYLAVFVLGYEKGECLYPASLAFLP